MYCHPNRNIKLPPSRTRFKINVKNVGGGEVYRFGTQYLSQCSPYSSAPLEYTDLDYVRVEDVSIGGQSILSSCNPPLDDGHMRLIKGQGSMYCTLTNIQTNTAYTTPITVKLRYGYRQTLFKNLDILNIR